MYTEFMSIYGRVVMGVCMLLLICFIALMGIWGWFLWVENPLEHPTAHIPWPVACSLRGCITATEWVTQLQARQSFAQAFDLPIPTPPQALTGLARQHLVEHAAVKPTVTLTDVRRYREEFLNLEDESQLHHVTDLTLEEYDKLVILPLLAQESLRQQGNYASYENLFVDLAEDRPMFVLLRKFRWDATVAEIVAR